MQVYAKGETYFLYEYNFMNVDNRTFTSFARRHDQNSSLFLHILTRFMHLCLVLLTWPHGGTRTVSLCRMSFYFTLRKHAYLNILKILPPKNENFQIKNSDIFHISAENIDCGYSLELLLYKSGVLWDQNYIGMFSWWFEAVVALF